MVIQCKNLISLYILPDQGRVNLLVFTMEPESTENSISDREFFTKTELEDENGLRLVTVASQFTHFLIHLSKGT